MKKFSKILVGLLVVVCIVEGFFLYRAYAIPSTTLQTARKINRIEQIIDKYYKGSVKKSELEDCTYKGLVAGLGDVYSTYYSEDDFKELEHPAMVSIPSGSLFRNSSHCALFAALSTSSLFASSFPIRIFSYRLVLNKNCSCET